MAEDNLKIIEKVGNLLRLSQSADEEEARTAAIQATRMMKEHKLVLVPQAEIDRIKTVVGDAQALAKKHEAEGMQRMAIAGLAGYMFGKNGKLF